MASPGQATWGGIKGKLHLPIDHAGGPQPRSVARGHEGPVERLRRGDHGGKRIGTGRSEFTNKCRRHVGPRLEHIKRAGR